MRGDRAMNKKKELLLVEHLKKYYPINKGLFGKSKQFVHAVDDVSFGIYTGETMGLVGESGCGKTSLAQCVLRLTEPDEGDVLFDGIDLSALNSEEMRNMRRRMQIVFQDPYASINPRMTVFETIRAPLDAFGIGTKQEREAHVLEMIDYIGLNAQQMHRYPHEFSGGQRQRIIIARALILNPDFIVCDEPVSALDVSIRSQVLNLLQDIQKERGLTYLFVSHDLSVVKHISTRVAVMYLGKIVELASCEDLFNQPLHPYSQALLAAIPIPDPEKRTKRLPLAGDVPNPANPPAGCRFHTRCPNVEAQCKTTEPKLREISSGRYVACHKYMG